MKLKKNKQNPNKVKVEKTFEAWNKKNSVSHFHLQNFCACAFDVWLLQENRVNFLLEMLKIVDNKKYKNFWIFCCRYGIIVFSLLAHLIFFSIREQDMWQFIITAGFDCSIFLTNILNF